PRHADDLARRRAARGRAPLGGRALGRAARRPAVRHARRRAAHAALGRVPSPGARARGRARRSARRGGRRSRGELGASAAMNKVSVRWIPGRMLALFAAGVLVLYAIPGAGVGAGFFFSALLVAAAVY